MEVIGVAYILEINSIEGSTGSPRHPVPEHGISLVNSSPSHLFFEDGVGKDWSAAYLHSLSYLLDVLGLGILGVGVQS